VPKGTVEIPEHLKIKPTDTEEEKVRPMLNSGVSTIVLMAFPLSALLSFPLRCFLQAKKKKRIRAIKNANRQQNYDSERNNKQSGWQQFAKKFSKKRPKGSMSAIHKNKGRCVIEHGRACVVVCV
jgi:hypothetical protein